MISVCVNDWDGTGWSQWAGFEFNFGKAVMTITCNERDYLLEDCERANFQITIHSQNSTPDMGMDSKYVSLPMGHDINMDFHHIHIKRLPPFYDTNCRDYERTDTRSECQTQCWLSHYSRLCPDSNSLSTDGYNRFMFRAEHLVGDSFSRLKLADNMNGTNCTVTVSVDSWSIANRIKNMVFIKARLLISDLINAFNHNTINILNAYQYFHCFWPKCQFKTSRRNHFNRHNECRKQFTTKRHLLQHKSAVHLNEKRLKCNEDNCGKCFAQNSYLIAHKRTQKPFVCHFTDCDKLSFAFKYMNNHKRRHFGGKPFQ
ncbi:unnamed protein product [Oppiella nova]|uniref:C2H2-type domain-containing protein n=1 Tax=Oppiella nova TaxID=334625 RepID=A0A7R9M4B0_9ACAR|nr:unnamed protein product [Oppiella nova]CAG2170271.1 unnamed protein product [Oppiella nova]